MNTDLSRGDSRGLRVSQVLPEAQTIGADDVAFRSCSGRWDECQDGDVFVALVEADQDGHDHVLRAIECGARAVVTERLLAIDHPQFIVDDTRLAFGKLCHALAGHPSRRLETIAISGADGKTTTAHLIDSILRTSTRPTGLISSIQPVGSHVQANAVDDAQSQSANPAAIANALANMVMSDKTHAVLETNSWQLGSRILSGLEADVAVLTNLRRDAAARHGSTANYLAAETRIFDCLKSAGIAVLNADDPLSQQVIDELNAPTLTVGIHQPAEIRAKLLAQDQTGQTFLLIAGDQSIPVQTSIPGKQHVYNCLAAAAALLPQGFCLADIAEGISRCHPVGRMERVDCGQDFGVWVDAAATANQIATAVHSLKRVVTGKIWCVASLHEHQSAAQRRRMGRVLERCPVEPVITLARPTPQIDYEPFHQLMDGMDRVVAPQVIPDRFRAIEWALEQAEPGDAVLITGRGERPVATIGNQEWIVTDKDICQAWLYDRHSYAAAPGADESNFLRIDDYR